jgi:ATP adenylyltransferase
MAYIKGLDPAEADPEQPTGCFLCTCGQHAAASASGRQDLVLVNDQRGLVVMNRYPYTSGHLLVAPQAHVAALTDMTVDQRAGLMELTTLASRVVGDAYNPQGLNVGINMGRAAGAGVPGHLHVHIVPRWQGDTNFMESIGQVRVIPQALEESYRMLAEALDAIEPRA